MSESSIHIILESTIGSALNYARNPLEIMENKEPIRIMEYHKSLKYSRLWKIGVPPLLIVSKVTVKSGKYTNILMGTVQAAIAHGVLDAVRAGYPQGQGQRAGIIYPVWLDPSVTEVDEVDHEALFDVHREATAKVIKKAMHQSRRSTGCWRTRMRSSITFTILD